MLLEIRVYVRTDRRIQMNIMIIDFEKKEKNEKKNVNSVSFAGWK